MFYSLLEDVVSSSYQALRTEDRKSFLLFPLKSPSNWWKKHESITFITLNDHIQTNSKWLNMKSQPSSFVGIRVQVN